MTEPLQPKPVVRRMKQRNRGTRIVRKKNNVDDLENDERNRKSFGNNMQKSVASSRGEEQSQPQAK